MVKAGVCKTLIGGSNPPVASKLFFKYENGPDGPFSLSPVMQEVTTLKPQK